MIANCVKPCSFVFVFVWKCNQVYFAPSCQVTLKSWIGGIRSNTQNNVFSYIFVFWLTMHDFLRNVRWDNLCNTQWKADWTNSALIYHRAGNFPGNTLGDSWKATGNRSLTILTPGMPQKGSKIVICQKWMPSSNLSCELTSLCKYGAFDCYL